MNTTNNQALTEFIEKRIDLIKKLEIIFFLVFLSGFTMLKLHAPFSHIVLTIGILTTAITLFFQAYKMFDYTDWESYNFLGTIGFTNFLQKIYFMGLSISTAAMLGFMQVYKTNMMLIYGCVTLIIITILSVFAKFQNKSKVYNFKFYLRIIIGLIFLGILAIEMGLIKL